ncbi:MAG: M48 family metalloprotease [Halococcoides sp.]
MDWETDRQLQIRMALAVGLLAIMPVAFIYAFVLAINEVGLPLLGWATDRQFYGAVYVEPWLVIGVVLVGFGAQYLLGDRIALRSIGARRVTADQAPELVDRVTRLAQTAGVPAPSVAVSDADVPNAFTVGTRPSTATIVVTRGLLDALDGDELDAVLAHELAHVKNRDVAVMSLAYVVPTITYLVAIVAFGVVRGVGHSLGSLRHGRGNGRGLLVLVAVVLVSSIVTLAISALFWLGSFTLFRVLSQYREFAADRAAAAMTGAPAALASALATVDDAMSDLPDRDLRAVDGGIEALYVAPIDDYQFGEDRKLISSDVFPATHPDTDERIDRLRDLAGEMA